MYINFWYPMIRSEDLGPDKPERAKVLGLNFAVFRDSKGRAHVLSDTCVHRGGSLGGAWELGKNPRIVGRLRGLPLPRLGVRRRGRLQERPFHRLRHEAAAPREGGCLPHRREVRRRLRLPGRPARERAPAPARDRGIQRPGLARQFRAGAGGGLLLRAVHRERPGSGAQRVRAPDPRLQGHQPRDLQGPGLRGGELPAELGHVVPAPVQRARPGGQDLEGRPHQAPANSTPAAAPTGRTR